MSEFQPEMAPAAHRLPHAPHDLLLHAGQVGLAHATLSRLLGRGLRFALPAPGMALLVLPQRGGLQSGIDAGVDSETEVGAGVAERDWLALDTVAGVLFIEDGERFLADMTGIDGGVGADAVAGTGLASDRPWPHWLAGIVAGRLRGTPFASLRAVKPVAALPASAGLMLQLRLRDDDHAVSTMAVALPQVWLALLADAGGVPLRMPLSDWLPLALSFPLLLGTHRLPLAAYDALACGDLILPENPHFDSAGQGRLSLGGRRWLVGFIASQRLKILYEEKHLDTDLMEHQAPGNVAEYGAVAEAEAEAGQAGEDAAEEPGEQSMVAAEVAGEKAGWSGSPVLTLHFELGRLRLTLDQLRALGPHSVLDLRHGSPQSIAIACGGAEVGRGEVVNVDGRLGVRITRWDGAC